MQDLIAEEFGRFFSSLYASEPADREEMYPPTHTLIGILLIAEDHVGICKDQFNWRKLSSLLEISDWANILDVMDW